MVKIRNDLMIKLQQFPLLPYRWYENPLRRNGNNYLTWNLQLRRNGNKPSQKCFNDITKAEQPVVSVHVHVFTNA